MSLKDTLAVWGLVIFPNSDFFASVSDEQTMRIWCVGDGRSVGAVDIGSWCHSIAMSIDGNHIATGHGWSSHINIWDMASFSASHPNVNDIKQIKTLSHQSCYVERLSYSQDGRFLASGSSDSTINIYNCEDSSYSLLKSLKDHSSYISSVSFINNTDWLVSGSFDKTVKIWNVENGDCLKTVDHSRDVNHAVVSRTGKYIIGAIHNGTIVIYERDDDEEDYDDLFGHIKNAAKTS